MLRINLAVDKKKPEKNLPACRERRRNPRISAPFPVCVRGITEDGERAQFQAELENLSSGGLFLRTDRNLREWKRLLFVMRLSLDRNPENPAAVVAARGEILRTQAGSRKCAGYAVALKSRRFV
jgi:c-di-GMP-binding flagellar brake protein YcgR